MIVRSAVPSDAGRVLVMAKAFHAASATPLPFSAAMASLVADAAITDDDKFCVVCADADDHARGVLVAHAGMHHFSPVMIASEIMWWIDPAFRGVIAGQMLDAYEDWARSKGCAFVHLAGLGASPVVSRLYCRRGFQPAETHFMKPLSA